MNDDVGIDPLQRAQLDDGTEMGRKFTEEKVGGLAAMPFYPESYTTVGSTISYLTDTSLGNGDRTGSLISVTLSTAAAGAGTFGKIKFQVHGSRIGIRYSLLATPTPPDFCVLIDGVAYKVTYGAKDWETNQVLNVVNPMMQWICPDVLDDEMHQVEIEFIGDVTGGSARTWYVMGFLAPKANGYESPRTNGASPGTVQTLTGSFVAIAFPNNAGFVKLAGLMFFNSASGTDHTVTIQYQGTTWGPVSVLRNSHLNWEPPGKNGMNVTVTQFKLMVDAGSDVKVVPLATYF